MLCTRLLPPWQDCARLLPPRQISAKLLFPGQGNYAESFFHGENVIPKNYLDSSPKGESGVPENDIERFHGAGLRWAALGKAVRI